MVSFLRYDLGKDHTPQHQQAWGTQPYNLRNNDKQNSCQRQIPLAKPGNKMWDYQKYTQLVQFPMHLPVQKSKTKVTA